MYLVRLQNTVADTLLSEPSKFPTQRTPDSASHSTIYHAISGMPDAPPTMAHITANDLKTRSIAAIEAALAGGRTEAVVSVRGTERDSVMVLAQYQHLRECPSLRMHQLGGRLQGVHSVSINLSGQRQSGWPTGQDDWRAP